MTTYVLSCCSTVDVPRESLDARGIAHVSFNYQLDGVPCKDDFGQTNPPAQLYAKMLAGADAKTSQVSVGEYVSHFEALLEQGHDILHVTVSSGISGTHQSACAAAELAESRFPGRRVLVVDSLCASAGYGMLMDRLADLRDEGMGLEELRDWAEAHKLEVQHWFFSSDLTFFVRGGRLSRTAGAVGGLLHICPLLNVAADGTLQSREKIRTKRRAISRAAEKMRELAQGGEHYADTVFISQSECREDAEELARLVSESFPQLDGEPRISDIGATIGCHTGPGCVALFFWGAPRAD